MFHLRHVALLSLHLPNHHARELSIFFNGVAHLSPLTRAHLASNSLIPFALEVMLARTRGVDALAVLLQQTKVKARRAIDDAQRQTWTDRGMRVGLAMASLLIDAGVSSLVFTPP